jgi:hypothetical protein
MRSRTERERRYFLSGGDLPEREYWVVVFDDSEDPDDPVEHMFTYEPDVEGAFRVALVESAVGEIAPCDGEIDDLPLIKLGVEETLTRGARPPGLGWARHECYWEMGRERRPCRWCDGDVWVNQWVVWRRTEADYVEVFHEPAEFKKWFEWAKKFVTDYARNRLKLVYSREEDRRE